MNSACGMWGALADDCSGGAYTATAKEAILQIPILQLPTLILERNSIVTHLVEVVDRRVAGTVEPHIAVAATPESAAAVGRSDFAGAAVGSGSVVMPAAACRLGYLVD